MTFVIHASSWACFCCSFKILSGYPSTSFRFSVIFFIFLLLLLIIIVGFVAYNNCWKSGVFCLVMQKLESQRRVCTNRDICNRSIFIYWTTPSTGYSSSCMFVGFYKQAVQFFFCYRIFECDLTLQKLIDDRLCNCWGIPILLSGKQLFCALR
jgi:hypothetical protein